MFSYLGSNIDIQDIGNVDFSYCINHQGLNDIPLDFNNQNARILAIGEREDGMRDSRLGDSNGRNMDEVSLPVSGQVMESPPWGPPINQPLPPIGPMDPNFGVFGGDPSMIGMMPVGFNHFGFMPDPNMGNFMGPPPPGLLFPPQKEIIHCKNCTLFPPNPHAPPTTTRERPSGCRTVFVGGLPENITQEIVQEVFETCGTLYSIRMSKKNFCHIRFEMEDCVDRALYLSGYRIRIGSNSDPPNTGRLHIDYAQARDDQYEWECQQRALQREHRHRQRMEEERLRPLSPPPIVYYSDHEASVLMEKLKGEDDFVPVVQVVITWLERGDCNKRNANVFYTMVQSTNSHVRRLTSEKEHHDQELLKMKEAFRLHMQGILMQFDQIEKVFSSASKQKVWDHFTKAQRKNIDLWRKIAEETRKSHQKELFDQRQEDEMELSNSEDDSEDPNTEISTKKIRTEETSFSTTDCAMLTKISSQFAETNLLKEENDNLRCQLEAYKNEVAILKSDNQHDMDLKMKQVKALQQALQGMQQQLITVKQKMKSNEDELIELRKLKKTDESENEMSLCETSTEITTTPNTPVPSVVFSQTSSHRMSEKDARLIGLMSTFLHVHPFGASVDYICSYLQRLETIIRPSDVEKILDEFPTIFKQEFSGVGASLERRWYFTAFEGVSRSQFE